LRQLVASDGFVVCVALKLDANHDRSRGQELLFGSSALLIFALLLVWLQL
jgi:hypothetical protein